jgi:uncharacterized membrane protein YgcG
MQAVGTEKNLHARRNVMRFRTRGFISLLLALSFLVAAVSGSVLFMTPRGRVANWTGWTMAGLTKHEWAALHINACLLMLIVSVIHLVLNWRVFWSYIQKKSVGFNLKWEMAASMLLAIAVVAGTLYEVPPLTATVALSERMKDYWEGQSPAGPAPHAEEFTLARLAQTTGLTAEDLASALKEEGIVDEGESTTIAELAERNGMVPSQIYAIVTRRFPEAAAGLPAGRGGGRGMGGGQGMGGGRGMGGGQGSGGDHGGAAFHGEGNPPSGGNTTDAHGTFGRGPGPGGRGMGMGRGMGGGMGGGRGVGRGGGLPGEGGQSTTGITPVP